MQKRGEHNQALLAASPYDMLAKDVTVENTTIQLPEVSDHSFRIRIYRPKNQTPSSKLPVYLYFHSGFWCAGDLNSEDFGCRAIIARGVSMLIISFEYRLVPETRWQTVFSDCENACTWLSTNAAQFGGDPSKGFLIGGATSGAHLAAITAIRIRDKHPDIKLTGQVLIVPTVLIPDSAIPDSWKRKLLSHTTCSSAPVIPQSLFEYYTSLLSIPATEARNPYNFPVYADVSNLPPTYLAMDEVDPTRDQGFLYADLLQKAGVKTRVDYYEGLPNMFVQFAELSTTLTAGIHLAAGLSWLVQGAS